MLPGIIRVYNTIKMFLNCQMKLQSGRNIIIGVKFEILLLKTNAWVEMNSSITIVLEKRKDTVKLTTQKPLIFDLRL